MSQQRALIVSTILMLLASVYINTILNKSEANVPREPLLTFPRSFSGWSSEDRNFTTPVLANLGVDDYLMRRYVNGKDAIWVYIGYYKSQKEGAVPHSPRHCYPGSGFSPVRHEVISIPVESPGRTVIRVNRYVFAKGVEREVVIYWYQSRGRVIADEYREKAYLIRDAVFRNRSDGALVRFSIGARTETQDENEKLLVQFIAGIYPEISRVVPD